jgi:BirA family biotin operon repressor/biotin-[acetyl-CoA-carboxylase] ligase
VAVPLADGLEGPRALVRALADGRLRTPAALRTALGCIASELEAAIEALRELGVEIVTDSDGSLRLAAPVEILDAETIRGALGERSRARLGALEVLLAVDSTNTRLLDRPSPAKGSAQALLAELQRAGRGRRGRTWVTPFGGSIALSLSWTFGDAGRANPALSLAVGVAVARALQRHGAQGIGLKWPNDIWFADRKIGGVLVEVRTEPRGAAQVVIGVGLNLSLSADMRQAIEGQGTRIAAVADASLRPIGRNALAAALLDELLGMLDAFEGLGFAAFRDEWTALDALGGRAVRLIIGNGVVEGVSRGVDAEGALLIDSEGQLRRFVSGEASLRLGVGGT